MQAFNGLAKAMAELTANTGVSQKSMEDLPADRLQSTFKAQKMFHHTCGGAFLGQYLDICMYFEVLYIYSGIVGQSKMQQSEFGLGAVSQHGSQCCFRVLMVVGVHVKGVDAIVDMHALFWPRILVFECCLQGGLVGRLRGPRR